MSHEEEAIQIIRKINHPALKLNLDIGTVLANGESLDWIRRDSDLINHVHISEPNLLPIKKRAGHNALIRQLQKSSYRKYVSIEMKANAKIVDVVCYAKSFLE